MKVPVLIGWLIFEAVLAAQSNIPAYVFGKADLATGATPTSLVIGDFNGDGLPDLVSTNSGSSSFSVLLSKSNGAFSPKADHVLVAAPSKVVAGDFNNDGKLDLAIAAASAGGTISVFLGRGDGTFSGPSGFGTANGLGMVVGDFNNDGHLDLAVADSNAGHLELLLGKGDGTFSIGGEYPTVPSPLEVVVGDFSADGNLDLAVGAQTKGISVLLGNGDGTFKTHVDYSVTANGLAASDVTGDGKLDLVTGNVDNTSQVERINVLPGRGDGTFQSPFLYATGVQRLITSVVVADFNSDGWPDIAAVGFQQVSVLLGSSSGVFQAHQEYFVPGFAMAASSADFNNDGRTDIAVLNQTTQNSNGPDSISLLINHGDGTFSGRTDTPTGASPQGLAALDLNSDGKLDLVVTNSADNTFSVFFGNGKGSFTLDDVSATLNPNPVEAIPFEISGGATQGFLVLSHNPDYGFYHELWVYQHGGSAVAGRMVRLRLNPEAAGPTDSNIKQITQGVGNPSDDKEKQKSGKFEKDKQFKSSLMRGPSVTSPASRIARFRNLSRWEEVARVALMILGLALCGVAIWKIYSPQRWREAWVQQILYVVTVLAVPWIIAALDSHEILAQSLGPENFASVSGFSNALMVFAGNDDGTFSELDYDTGNSPFAVAGGDFNGDGFTDLAVSNFLDNTVSIFLNSGTGSFLKRNDFPVGKGPQWLTIGDFDGDGNEDVAVTNSIDNSVSILRGSGSGTLLAHTDYPVGLNPYAVLSGDFNGDGKLDLVVSSYSNNSVAILLGNGDGTLQPRYTLAGGNGVNVIVAANFTGSGLPDLAATNSLDNTFSVWPNTSVLLCTDTLSASNVNVAIAGGANSATVTTSQQTGCHWTATSNVSWIRVTSGSPGTGNGTVNYSVAANPGAQRTGILTIAGQTLTVVQAGAGTAAPAIQSVVNGASFGSGLSSGSWTTILGANLSATTRSWQASDFNGNNLPTSLDGVQVKINGNLAYVYYISPTQLNVLAPDDAATGTVPVQVLNASGASNLVNVDKQPASPAFFAYPQQGGRYAIAQDASTYALLAPVGLLGSGLGTSPAKPGEYITLYATGLGATNPPYPAGQIIQTPEPLTGAPVVTIGGATAAVQFAGIIGSGLYQINAIVPNLPAGDASITVTVNGVQSPAGTYIPIAVTAPAIRLSR